jgi:hypothetical protein
VQQLRIASKNGPAEKQGLWVVSLAESAAIALDQSNVLRDSPAE